MKVHILTACASINSEMTEKVSESFKYVSVSKNVLGV